MEYRKLKSTDVGMICKIISGIGIKEFKNVFDGVETGDKQALGAAALFGIGGVVIENLPKVQKDLNVFLASVADINVKELDDMDLVPYTQMIYEVITKEEFKDFFSLAMKLLPR